MEYLVGSGSQEADAKAYSADIPPCLCFLHLAQWNFLSPDSIHLSIPWRSVNVNLVVWFICYLIEACKLLFSQPREPSLYFCWK